MDGVYDGYGYGGGCGACAISVEGYIGHNFGNGEGHGDGCGDGSGSGGGVSLRPGMGRGEGAHSGDGYSDGVGYGVGYLDTVEGSNTIISDQNNIKHTINVETGEGRCESRRWRNLALTGTTCLACLASGDR